MKYFLVGIKGTGMSALAKALKTNNEEVFGSDNGTHYFTEDSLKEYGIEILEFNKLNIDKYLDCEFISSYAYDENNNEEINRLKELNIKFYYYSEFINSYFKGIKIGVSGSHGKTTVSKMLSSFLNDSAYIIGDGSGFCFSGYKYFIIEACEYKRHFLEYDYDYLIINNIDYDHPDYYLSEEDYVNAFKEASSKAKCIIVNGDNCNSRKIRHKNKYSFGFNRGNYCLINLIEENAHGFIVEYKINKTSYIFNLNFYGRHMLYNFAPIVILFHLNKLNIKDIDLSKFQMPRLRMEEKRFKSNIVIDDYAHHPYEIKCLLDSLKQKYPSYDFVTIFQPHTYSRTFKFKNEFSVLFDNVYESYIAKTFTSREAYDKSKERKVKRIFKKCKYITTDDFKKICKYENKLIIFIGAGDTHSDKLFSFS